MTQQIDFNGAVGKMLAAVLLGVAEMEQETRRERQKVGIDAARERVVHCGRQQGAAKAKPEQAKALLLKGNTRRDRYFVGGLTPYRDSVLAILVTRRGGHRMENQMFMSMFMFIFIFSGFIRQFGSAVCNSCSPASVISGL